MRADLRSPVLPGGGRGGVRARVALRVYCGRVCAAAVAAAVLLVLAWVAVTRALRATASEDAAKEPIAPIAPRAPPQTVALAPPPVPDAPSRAAILDFEAEADAALAASSATRPNLGYLTACVMAKDAAAALPEFVARNHLAGVDHFVIMDDSDPAQFEHLHRVLEPMSAIVTLVRVSRTDNDLASTRGWSSASQITSLLECAESVRDRTTWVAFVDVDEFFEANEPWASREYRLAETPETPFMRTFLREAAKNASRPAVCVRWRTVLTNGRVHPPPCGTTLASYFPQVCNVTGRDGHPLARRKAIVRVEWLDTTGTPLDDSYGHIGYRFLPPHHEFRCIVDPPPEEISIMHYWSMSLMDYLQKIARGRPRRSLEQRTMFDLLWREQMCDLKVQDSSSLLRDTAVREMIGGFGYQCQPVSNDSKPWDEQDEQNLHRFVSKDNAALRFLVGKVSAGYRFNATRYAQAFNLPYKSIYGGFLAAIDLIPWIHFYLHGYNPDTADRWFQ